MNIQLHKNARTPPAIRLELQSQPESVSDREDALREAGAKMPVKPVKAYDPGCVHVDVKYLPTCRMRTIGSTALPRLTAPPAGSTSNASRTSQPPLPAVSSRA